jgi:hypothetical protein
MALVSSEEQSGRENNFLSCTGLNESCWSFKAEFENTKRKKKVYHPPILRQPKTKLVSCKDVIIIIQSMNCTFNLPEI